jgi:phage-related protein
MQQFEDRFSNAQQDFTESVQQLEDQFNSEISQTEANFNDQIESVSESFTSVGSNLQSGIESTQNAVGSLSGSLARLVSGDSENSEGNGSDEGLPTSVIALGAAAIAAVGYYVTQRDQ